MDEKWDLWVKTVGQPTVWTGFDLPEIIETYVVLPQSTCRYPDCDGGPATGYCHVRCRDDVMPADADQSISVPSRKFSLSPRL
jgi:hypothetical protein